MNKKQKKELVQNWEIFFIDRGVSEHLVDQYVKYVERLVESNLPVIFEIEHLSKLIGIDLFDLHKIVGNPNYFYREFTIPKKRGGTRTVTAPYPSLLMCQTWIYENILKPVPVHFCSHAYRENKSIITNATPHLNQKALLKMDMKDFFPSIPINWVINLFSQLGYPNNISYYLARICCFDNALPQGASTSPALSNILLRNLDSRLYKLSKSYNLNYTRYADDMAFSGHYIPHKIIGIIERIISDYGLLVNSDKTTLIVGDKQKIVTGISVKGNSLALPRSSKRLIKQEIHYIKQYGLVSHISKLKIKNPYYLQSLEGKLRFWLQIEPESDVASENLYFIKSLLNNK
ncbi:reverse transcriptase family protein [Enterovibrio sp. ZSDZ42]|uniref:RNA-directed DNA polymerase n=1 Tax=Enterovibrio gelatinilyticus TaxID=2899819 RepID=A0ABT5R3I9_9GAMM|nr:reverse transcriptase family protein [Enterovibrio sp. ZSDZ42]MDD1794336.1 reverse transcriptase family protein [Enterovibrio sp. ZSDZ42]